MLRHISHEQDPGARGRALGAALPEAVGATVALYERLFAAALDAGRAEVAGFGRRVGEALARLRPAALEEICAIAHGAGQPEELLLAANARNELLAGLPAGAPRLARRAGECSALALARDERRGALLAQNWDFHPDVAPTRLLWIAAPAGGRGWATLTEVGQLAKTGVNADGFALTVNFVADERDGGLDGVPSHVLLRWLLEECATLADVEAVVARAPRGSSLCATAAARRPSARGRLAAFELAPDAYAVLAPDARGRLAHTNHFLTAVSELASAARPAIVANSAMRLEQLRRALAPEAEPDLAAVMEALSDERDPCDPVFVRADAALPWVERCATVATVAYEIAPRAMWLRSAPGARARFERVALPWA